MRRYLRAAFADWELADQWDWAREAHSFRLVSHQQPVHLLKVSRELLDDNEPARISAILAASSVAAALRATPGHRLLLTSDGLSELDPA